MTGFGAFLGKEFREIARTWRIWVLPAIMLFFASSGPVMAYFMKPLLQSLSGGQLAIQIPDPTWRDAYASWTKNLSQLGAMALVILYGGLISAEQRLGTTVLVLTKPVSRLAFVIAKLVAAIALVAASLLVGGVVQWALTRLLFRAAPVRPLLAGTAFFLLLAAILVAAAALFSALFASSAAAAGAAFGLYLVLSLASAWGPAARYSPAGLVALPGQLAAEEPSRWGWPVLTGVVGVALLVAITVLAFRRREL